MTIANTAIHAAARPESATAPAMEFAGRVLLALIFLVSGLGKLGAYAGTQAYMAANGVPGWTLPLVIVLEVLGALALILGWRARLAAFALALFSLASAVLFHWQPADPMQQIMFLKNLAIAGGLLLLAARGAGGWSLDARSARLGAV